MFWVISLFLLIVSIGIQIFIIINKISIIIYFFIFFISILILFYIFTQRKVKIDKDKIKKIKKIEKEELFFKDNNNLNISNPYFVVGFIFVSLLLLISYFFEENIPIIFQIIILIITAFLFLVVKNKKILIKKSKKTDMEIYLVFILIIIAFFFRFAFLGEKPEGINTDEELFANIGLSISKGGDPQTPFIGESDHQMGSPAYYLTGLFFKIFGVNLFSLRLFSNLSGILSIILFYFFLRLFFNYQIALLAALLFATNHVYLHVTRWMHIFPATPFFIWAGFFFLIAGLRQKNFLYIIISGILTGWSIYFYNSNKFLPIIFFIYMIYEVLINKSLDKKFYLKSIGVFFISFILAFLPLAFYIINNFNTYFLHVSEVKAKFDEIFTKIFLYLGMLTIKGSPNPWLNFPNMPLLDRISSFFFLIGFTISILTVKKRESFVALSLFFIGLIPAVFSNYWAEPNNQRAIITFASSFLFIAIAINFLYSIYGKATIIIKYFLIILILFSSINGVYTYFFKMLKNSDIIWAFSPYEFKIQKLYKDNFNKYDIYLSKFFLGGNLENRPFIGREIYFYNLPNPKFLDVSYHSLNGLLMFNLGDKDVLLVFEAFFKDAKNFILKRFPNAIIEIIKNPYQPPNWGFDHHVLSPDVFDRDILFTLIKIPKNDIEKFKGLIFNSDDGKIKDVKVFLNGSDLQKAEKGKIQGSIRIFEIGEYVFNFESFELIKFEISGKKIKIKNKISEPVKLFPGIHPVDIELLKMNGSEKLLIKKITQNQENEFKVIPQHMLISEIRNCGFMGKFYKSRQENSEILWEEISPSIYNKWYGSAIPGRQHHSWADSMKIIWESNLNIKNDGSYLFECPSPGGDAFIYVDDNLVYTYKSSEGGRKYNFKWIDLKKRIYKFKLISEPFSIGTTNNLSVKFKANGKILVLEDECLFLLK